MDELISKGRGKLKSMKARLTGVVGVFKTLTQQHGELEALLVSVKRDADKREDLWPKIRIELLSHERAEIQEVYPVLRAQEKTRMLADKHDAEASEIEQFVQQLDATEIASDSWGTQFARLADAIMAHATEEETEIFPVAQQLLGETRARQLDERFVAAKKRIMESA